MNPDPYENLAAQLAGRKAKYLRTIAAEAPGDQPAYARGYLKVPGNKVNGASRQPTDPSPQERDEANKAREDNLAFWEDTPALRTEAGASIHSEKVNAVIARLKAANLPDNPTSIHFPPPFVDKGLEFPEPTVKIHFRKILTFIDVIAVRVWLQDLEDGEEAGDWKDHSVLDWIVRELYHARELFKESKISERIRDSFGLQIDANVPTPSAALIEKLGKLTVEGEKAVLFVDRAGTLLKQIARLLHTVPTDTNPTDLYTDFEALLSKYVDQLQPNLFSQVIEWPKETWNGFELLATLGGLDQKPFSVALVDLAKLLPRAPNCTTDESRFAEVGENPFLLAQLLFRPNVSIPKGWVWPGRKKEDIYWWRAVIKEHLVDHILSYKDTADFHVADVLRFVGLFGLFKKDRDPRIPSYVENDIKLALQNFKYWFDGPPEFDREKQITENSPNKEMTFWSENHIILFASAQVLVGQLFRQFFPDDLFFRSARDGEELTGETLEERGKKLVHRWLDDRLRFGFSEWNAPGYYNEDLPPLFNLVDFCDDKVLSTKATMVLDLLVYDMARFNSRGSFGTTTGRAYFEHKAYGWAQSVGNTMEILFGTRRDFTNTEPGAVALATSSYDVPHALIAIGLDRVYKDHERPLIDRSRVSIDRDEARSHGIGFTGDHDVAYWWSTSSYFTEETLEGTRRVVERHDNLKTTTPFSILYPDPNLPWYAALVDVILRVAKTPIVGDAAEAYTGSGIAAVGRAGLLLPFPLNVVSWGVGAAGTTMLIKGVVNVVVDVVKTGIRLVEKIFGDDDEEKPTVPHSTVIKFLEQLLIHFNEGTTLSRVNLYTYCNGDVLLSSVQNHLKGKVAFQKSAWQATIDSEACVWTGTPPSNTEAFLFEGVGVHLRAWLQFLKDVFRLRPISALMDPLMPILPSDLFGHDGPNYWTGEFALPMVVQHERAAIIAYNIPNLQRTMHATVTHAWFPKNMFDENCQQDVDDGTWLFGRKNDAFVALYSARQVDWQSSGSFKDKEIYAEGGSNIWICVVGNTLEFKPAHMLMDEPGREEEIRKVAFETFRNEVANAYLSISGVGTWNQLHCSFDIPRTSAPPRREPRLELFYDDDKGQFAGEKLTLDNFRRFENKYGRVEWGARNYEIRHPLGLSLTHDLAIPSRSHTVQISKVGTGDIPFHGSARREPLIAEKSSIFKRSRSHGG